MTLAESKKTKHLTITGTFTEVPDLTELWFKLYPMGNTCLSGTTGHYSINYKSEFHTGLYALGVITEAVRQAKGNCHLEVSAVYED